jgi:hypothetical protein
MMKIILFHHHISLVLLIVIGIMMMIAKGQELVMMCSLDNCDSFVQTTVIDGCTMISSSDGSSQAFTFDPMAEDPACALKFYSEANCTSMISCTDYDVSDTSPVICSSPGTLVNPCGTGVDYKIDVVSDPPTKSPAPSSVPSSQSSSNPSSEPSQKPSNVVSGGKDDENSSAMMTTTTITSTTSLISTMMMLYSLLW